MQSDAQIIDGTKTTSYRVCAVAKHFGLEYGIALNVAEGLLPRNAARPAGYWSLKANSDAMSALGSEYAAFLRVLGTLLATTR